MATETLSTICRRVSNEGLTGRKNGSPMRNPSAKSIAMSGNGRPPSSSNWGGPGRRAPGISGPSYQRGRSSRANCTRSSLDTELVSNERRLPLTACEWSASIPFADTPQESTSNVPFTCSDHV